MATLIIVVLAGLAFTYFALQNTVSVTLQLVQYTLPNVPLFAVAAGALLVGLILSWIINLTQNIGNIFMLRGKERTIQDYKKENLELTKEMHHLELENARLKAETEDDGDDKSL